MEKEAAQEQTLTGRQRIGNNIVGGQIIGKVTRTLSPAGHSIAVLTLRGEISLETLEDRYTALKEAEGQDCRAVLLDLTDVPFVDCAGFGMLLSCCRRLKAEGRDFALVGASPLFLRALHLTRLHRVLRAYGSLEAAQEAIDMEAAAKSSSRKKSSSKKVHSPGHNWPIRHEHREEGAAASDPAHETPEGVSLPA